MQWDSTTWRGIAIALLIVAGAILAWALLRPGKELIIYSSLPLYTPSMTDRQTADMVNAIDLALEQKHHKAGKFTVKHVSLDDSTKTPGGFTVAATARNARRAADDENTAGYIGDFNSGATAVSIAILSAGAVPQISPASTAVGLTTQGRDRGSADPGEPETYYYEGYRNFVRVVPEDSVQAEALTRLMKSDGCARLAMINDGGYYGVRLAREMGVSTRLHRLKLVFNKTIGTRKEKLPGLASSKSPDCFLYSGARDGRTLGLFTAVARRLPAARLYGPDGLAETVFTEALDPTIAGRVQLTLPARDRAKLGTEFIKDYRTRFKGDAPEPYAVYAYESTLLLLDAIERSGTGKRTDIVRKLFDTTDRASAVGRYSIDENGDTDRKRDYDVYGIRSDGRLKYLQTVGAGP